jgi:aerobic carbon-monoxide dehydrogenase large subunit
MVTELTEGRATIGDAPKRREDRVFLTGKGAYLDDLTFDGICHAVFVRSPHAHARISSIDIAAARNGAGVLAILTARDVEADGLLPLGPPAATNPHTGEPYIGEPFAFLSQPLLAEGVVRHVGEAVALVIAETHAQALDAADLVDVTYGSLQAITTPEEALSANAPVIAPGVDRNLCLDVKIGDESTVDAAFPRAAHIVELALDNHRIVTNPMEPRGVVGTWDRENARYVLHISTQNLHAVRDVTARALGVEAQAVRFVAPDVGGGFGTKNFGYTEYPLIAWAARRLNRPVKWIASRSEVFLTDHQARDHHSVSRLALDRQGRFLALKVESVANLGAYLIGSMGVVETALYAHLPGTVYDIPAIALHIQAVFTNTTPNGVTRAPGYAEANMVIERLIDAAARQCGFDRAELRRLNMARADQMPFTNALGETVDSGAFAETLDMALARADVDGFEARRRASQEGGRLRGLGFAYHIKGTGGSPHENVELRFETDDSVSLFTGTQTIGQGHHTTFPQIMADLLGLDNAQIHLREGDTDLIPKGGGHGSSRSTYMAGTAIFRAVEEIIAKGAVIAGEALEASPSDIVFEDGRFSVAGTDRAIGLMRVAGLAREAGTPLDTYHAWTRNWMTFPNGAHVVEIEIDRDTGRVEIDRYTAVDDYGVVVNPMIAAGQAHGAITQGIGQALLERTVHVPGTGQPLAASFMDYAMPRADDVLSYDLAFNPTRCTTNPLGVKGCGEAGVVAGPPAIANAIVDALAPLGVTHFDGAATPERVWRAMNMVDSRG